MEAKTSKTSIIRRDFDIDKYYKKYGISQNKIQQKENTNSPYIYKEISPYQKLFEKYNIVIKRPFKTKNDTSFSQTQPILKEKTKNL